MAKYEELKPKDILLKEGEESNQLYYLTQGNLRVLKERGNNSKELAKLYPGEVVGEMSFLDNESRCATVEAINDSIVQVIQRKKYEEFLNDLPPWFFGLQKTLLERLRDANKRVEV
jgi:CRP/FNR family transcriptional regulator, cyclic AMP receptor protein